MYLGLDIKNKQTDEWQQVNWPSNQQLSVSVTSPLWNTGTNGVFSYPFTIDIDSNLHIFGTAASLNGSSIYNMLDKAKCRLYVNGNIMYQGIIKMDDSIEINYEDDRRTVEVNFENGCDNLEDILNGVKVRDLDFLKHKIQIGYTLPEELPFHGSYLMEVYGLREVINNGKRETEQVLVRYENIDYTRTVTLPKILVVDYHDSLYNTYTQNFCNVQKPYNPSNPLEAPYCNARAAYQKYVWSGSQWKEERGTSVGEPDRVNSAPCFYFGFVHDELFRQLGVNVTYNALNGLLDYCRLAFWNTRPEYETEEVEGKSFDNNNQDNKVMINVGYASGRQYCYYYSRADVATDYTRRYALARSITTDMKLCRAYATADNLPDIEAQEIIDAAKSAFGARYDYDAIENKLRIVLVRDVLASSEIKELESFHITGDMVMTENPVKGIRFKYSASNEASKNTITKKEYLVEGSDETTYNYNDYRYPYILGQGEATSALQDDGTADLITSFGLETPMYDYSDLIKNITDSDLHLYIDPNTSNCYRIKVDGDATTQADWFPSLFQVAAFRDVTIGDVSDDADPEEISIPFTPVIPTDTNFYEEYKAANADGVAQEDSNGGIIESEDEETPSPIYAQLIDGEIHHHADNAFISRRYHHAAITIATLYDHGTGKSNICCHIDLNVDIRAVEDYEVNNNSDGPYFDNEPTFTLGIMRGSGTSAQTIMYNDNYDGEGHYMFMETNGTDAEFTSDTLDTYGNMYDYNGGGETTVTPEQAKSYIIVNFPKSNVNLIPDAPSDAGVTGSYANRLKGWNSVIITTKRMDVKLEDGTAKEVGVIINRLGKRFIVTGKLNSQYSIIHDTETGISYDEETQGGEIELALSDYFIDTIYDYYQNGGSTEQSIMAYDAQKEKMLVDVYDSYSTAQSAWALLLDLGDALVGDDDTVTFPDNGFGYEVKDLISLRLKSEIPIDGIPSRGYYPVTNPLARNRGLADKFYGAYFHWLMNRKAVKIPCTMSKDDLKSIDFFTRYRFGNIVGYVNNITYNITNDGDKDNDGISDIVLEVYYL